MVFFEGSWSTRVERGCLWKGDCSMGCLEGVEQEECWIFFKRMSNALFFFFLFFFFLT